MEARKVRSALGSTRAKNVVHARVGTESCEVLEELAKRQGVTHTQALRNLLDDAKERMAEEAFGPRLESLARTLLGVVEQQARHATRIEALVASPSRPTSKWELAGVACSSGAMRPASDTRALWIMIRPWKPSIC